MFEVKLNVLSLCLFIGPSMVTAGPFTDVKNLYAKNEPGINSVEASELDTLVIGSSKPWMVQFYSSWCGHCQHFQPIFSEFGARVEGWTEDVMGIAVINCAAEHNTQTCRDYDIMGYPTLKVFSAHAPAGDRGSHLQPTPHDVPSLVKSMLNWALDQQEKDPALKTSSTDLTINDRSEGLVVLDYKDLPYMVEEVILDLYAATKNRPNKLNLSRMDAVSFAKQNPGSTIRAGSLVSMPQKELLGVPQSAKELTNLVIKHYNNLFPESPLSSLKYVKGVSQVQNPVLKPASSTTVAKKTPAVETSASEIKRRRYTVFLRDAETALMYALSHEVGQRKVIGGKSLTTLKQLLRVLRVYYPSNQGKTHEFLRRLDEWVAGHDDAIKGSDLENTIVKFNGKTKPGEYLGCKGSASNYGGYPCGLWTLWHLLTIERYVQHPGSSSPEEDQEVLRAMVNYVDDFFGCRDCARHFLTMAEDGAAITRDVKSSKDAVMWLWKAHNRVNVRLKGDVSDDPAFPKAVFPAKDHCPSCYNDKVGGYNLDVEFFKDNVRDFLVDMFHTNLNYSGTEFTVTTGDEADRNLPAIRYSNEVVDDTNFMADPAEKRKGRKNSDFRQNSSAVTSAWFFTMADISLCFAVYVGSTLLILAICYKFCSKRLVMKIVNKMFKDDSLRHDPGKMV